MSHLRRIAFALTVTMVVAACAPVPPHVPGKVKNTPRKVVIIGDSLVFVDQARIIEQVEKDGKWDVVLLDSKLGTGVSNHPNLPTVLANTTYDAVVMSFGYNEISDIRGNFLAPVPFETKIAYWRNAVASAKTDCLGWLTLQHDGWLKVGAEYESVLLQSVRRFNSSSGAPFQTPTSAPNGQTDRTFGSTPMVSTFGGALGVRPPWVSKSAKRSTVADAVQAAATNRFAVKSEELQAEGWDDHLDQVRARLGEAALKLITQVRSVGRPDRIDSEPASDRNKVLIRVGQIQHGAGLAADVRGAHPVEFHVQDGVRPVVEQDRGHIQAFAGLRP